MKIDPYNHKEKLSILKKYFKMIKYKNYYYAIKVWLKHTKK